MIIETHLLPATPSARHHCRMGVGGWHWNDAWIFVSAVIAERLERDRAVHAALPATGASLADVLAAADFLHHSVPAARSWRLPYAGWSARACSPSRTTWSSWPRPASTSGVPARSAGSPRP